MIHVMTQDRYRGKMTQLPGSIPMTANIGSTDRMIRIIVGIALIAATLFGTIGAWGWIGVIPLATGLFRFCPAYLPFGFSSCATKDGSASR